LEKLILNSLEKILKKLDSPPSGPNFVRLLAEEPNRATKNIVSLVLGMPPFHYQDAYLVMRDRISHGISLETALRAIEGRGAPVGRKHNRSLIRAFFQYDELRKYSASNPIGFDRGYYSISRDIKVPIEPLSVIRESGKFTSIFLCGWNDVDCLSDMQRRFYCTMAEDAFLSLTDYQDGPAEYLFFPKLKIKSPSNLIVGTEIEPLRTTESWNRDKYKVLSRLEMSELIQIHLEARQNARKILFDMAAKGKFDQKQESTSSSDVNRDEDLFDFQREN
jgi:hypothetical protein